MVHVHLWYPVFLVPAVLFEVVVEILPGLIILFEISLRPASLFSQIINWIAFVVVDAARRLLVTCVLNSSACNRRPPSLSKGLAWSGLSGPLGTRDRFRF
jgi:hypothetical protein